MAVDSWSTTAADNDDADLSNGIDWREGQLPSTVNNSARAQMKALKHWFDRMAAGPVAAATVGGTADVITLTYSSAPVLAYATGLTVLFIAGGTNTTAVTINVDSLGAKSLKYRGSALGSGAISSGDLVAAYYDGTEFEMLTRPRSAGTSRSDEATIGNVQDGVLNWADAGGTADAITATYSPAITALVDGQLCCVRATAANATTTPTFSPNGLTARTIVKQGGTALLAGDIHGDGHELVLRYDLTNTRWELLNPHSVTLPNGSASLPSISFDGDADTGIYFDGSLPRMCFGGSNVAWWNATSFNPAVCRVGDGSVSLPGLAFAADTDTGFYRTGANAWSAATGGAQSFALSTTAMTMGSAIDLVLDSGAPTSVYSAGFRGAPVIDGNSAYAFPLADSGKTIYHNEAGTRTWTIPANASVAHPIGTVFILDNTGNSGSAGTITLAITSDTLRRGDGTAGTGSRTIAASKVAVIRKVASTEWVITGSFS